MRDLDLVRHGYHVYPQGPYFAPRQDGRYLQLPDDKAARREQVAKFSDQGRRRHRPLGRLAGRAGRDPRPAAVRHPAQAGLAQARPTWPARRCCCGGCKDVDTRRAVDLTRLMTASIADLVEDHFESDAMQGVLSVSGVIGTWAGPRSAGTAYVMLTTTSATSATGTSARGASPAAAWAA